MTPHVDELISAYIDDELTDPERANVDEHLTQCNDCRALADVLLTLKDGIFTTFQSVPVPEDLETMIMARIEEKVTSKIPVSLKFPWVGITIAVVTLLIVATAAPFMVFGFRILPTLFHLLINITKILPIMVSSIPFLVNGLIVFTLILTVLSIWALKRVFERGGLIEKRVG